MADLRWIIEDDVVYSQLFSYIEKLVNFYKLLTILITSLINCVPYVHCTYNHK